jgi:tRNA-specific 2-thiouridylase
MNPSTDKVLVALSGGKESLVTAWLLKKQGMQLRGVFFDLSGGDRLAETIAGFERKLGISIQVVNARAEAEAFLMNELNEGLLTGRRLDLKAIFHQKYLFPKLFEFKEHYQFQKIASGHRVLIQKDSIENLMKVYRYSAVEDDESSLVVGLNQEQLAALILPLGNIPGSMIDKIATELQVVDETAQFDLDWNEMLQRSRKSLVKDQTRNADVVNTSGGRVGFHPDFAALSLGDHYQDPEDSSREYSVFEIDAAKKRVTVGQLSKRVIRELHLEDAAWFSRADLKMESIRCAMVWSQHPKAVPVRLIQFEGQRMKAFLETPLEGADADIFNGQIVLWVTGAEVLGGARVMGCKE